MLKSSRSKADELFAKNMKRDKDALKEKEKREIDMAKKTATLRALRLAKEAEERAQAERDAATKSASGPAKRKTKSDRP